MIFKTKSLKSAGKGLLKYIERGTKKNLEEYKGLFNSVERAEKNYINKFLKYGEKNNLVRHMIIAPERYIMPEELNKLVREFMDLFILRDGRYSIRYIYGLHYNTKHPHSHIALSSFYPEDMLMKREDIVRVQEYLKEVFNEEIGRSPELMEEIEKEMKEADMEIG